MGMAMDSKGYETVKGEVTGCLDLGPSYALPLVGSNMCMHMRGQGSGGAKVLQQILQSLKSPFRQDPHDTFFYQSWHRFFLTLY